MSVMLLYRQKYIYKDGFTMTLGDKIRKYRNLKAWTQKDLGLKIGFSAATADSRIRKYEKDIMAPKDDIRNKLSSVLDVDIEAISDISITSFKDLMYVFFELEEKLGMEIEKRDGKTYLSFDDSNSEINTLITYLNIWKNQKAALLPNSDNITDEQQRKYDLWKSKFAQTTEAYFSNKKNAVDAYYDVLVQKATKSISYAKKTSEITILLRKLVEAGYSLSTVWGYGGPGFTFAVNELLNPSSDDAAMLFALFISELKHFEALGVECPYELQMPDNTLTITYFIPIDSFSVIRSQINEFLEYRKNNDNENDFLKDQFEMTFNHSIEMHYNVIQDEIELYKISKGVV